jgi:hypothetical protein
MRTSTAVTLAGLVLLVVPIPPITSAILGIVVVALGLALRFVFDS